MNVHLSKSEISEKILDKKVLVIGLDGASKRIIDRMIGQKELPVIDRLINTGSYYHSAHSFKPCASPVIWTSISTGKKPEKHGVKGFYDNSYSLTAKRIWEIFNMLGFPVGAMGHFLTWPPEKLDNSFIIPAILALGKECYPEKYGFLWELTHDAENEKKIKPRRMLKYLSECYGNGVKLSTLFEGVLGFTKKKFPLLEDLDKFFFMSSISMRTKFYRDVFIDLYKTLQPRYAYFHIHLLDTYSHHYWQYMEPELFENIPEADVKRYGQKIYNAYRNSDRIIGDIVNSVDPGTLIVVVSDHGFKAMPRTEHWSDKFTIRSQKFADLDTRGEMYISIIIPTVHVIIRNAAPEKNDHYRRFLQSVEILEDRKPLFRVEELEPGSYLLEFNREIDEISGKHIVTEGKSYPLEEFLMPIQEYTPGVHDEKDGILIFSGPDVRHNGYQEYPVSVFDIVPTILALCNLPVGRDMDGRVITEAIEDNFLQKYPVQYIDTYEKFRVRAGDKGKTDFSDEEAVTLKEQLKNLGYF
ncbi:MAG TPA: hypothetical protein ENG83_04100 [Nitrospirae bacterium]|nr:type I phosphodiesterase / nucleotide pyrophosphatase [bacterium BMS3Abin06]HDH11372.1 hypothetical protein [Nitrospirota bacterium]HDZ03363.1 hypothetical protein [Nitrospirota bacterium]